MKVKNIVFSGFMAAILSATGANAAISVASKAYVDKFVGEQGSITTELNGLKQTVTDNKTETDNALGLKANTADVEATYATKTFVGSLEGKNAATIVEYIDDKTKDIASGTAFSELTGRVGTAEGKITALETLTGTDGKIAQDIAQALNDAKGYADGKAADAQAAAEATAAADATAKADAAEAAAKEYVDSEITKFSDEKFSATANQVASNKTAIEGLLNSVDAMDDAYKAADQTLQGNIDTLSGTVSDMDAAYKLADTNLESSLKTYADGKAEAAQSAAEATASADATSKANAAQAAAEATASADATAKANKALEDAKKYADDQDAAQTATITAAYQLADTNLKSDLEDYADAQAKAVADTLKYLATAEVPEKCLTGEDGSNMCVLTLTSAGTFAWTPLTTPVEQKVSL